MMAGEQVVGESPRSVARGGVVAHSSVAAVQREANRQPAPNAFGAGTTPRIWCSRSAPASSETTEPSRPRL